MKILLIGPTNNQVISFFKDKGNAVDFSNSAPEYWDCLYNEDIIISYNYKYIIKKGMIDKYYGKILNLHTSLLPWNRGANPNLWSWVDNTPKGVTLHHIDEGVDTGDIIAQRIVKMDQDETLATSYAKLNQSAIQLLMDTYNIDCFKSISEMRIPQQGKGTIHNKKDIDKYRTLLVSGWDTSVNILQKKTT
jgi:methionyl-tRNA formyltransferase